MTQDQYLDRFSDLLEDMLETTTRKNKDYAQSANAFANFEQITILSGGSINVEMGLLVRMSDKMARIANLIKQKAQVKEESLDDTLKDLAVYATIFRVYRHWKLNQESNRPKEF